MTSYDEIIEAKRIKPVLSGFEVSESDLHNSLFDFQKYCTRLALKHGRYGLFQDCGLGKTFQGLVWANEVVKHTLRPVIILCPFAVVDQTIAEAHRWGIEIWDYSELIMATKVYENSTPESIFITNYEQLDNIDPEFFSGIWLDESSILKNETGAYRNKLINGFRDHQFKLCTTATPSPNDPMEIGNHAEFLGVMGYNEMLAMFFTHDGSDTAKWKLKGYAKDIFYEWMNTWSVMLSKPSDIGFSAIGYDLPELNFIERQIKTPQSDGKMFNDTAVSATNMNREFRITLLPRLEAVKEIVESKPGEQFSIWIKLNPEGEHLKKLIHTAIEVTGGDKPEFKKKMLLGFGNKEFDYIITKAKIASFGLNWQQCWNAIVAGVDFSHEALYQLIRRHYRFGQTHDVNVWLVTTDTMSNVLVSINKKLKAHHDMQKGMTKAHLKQMGKEKVVKVKADQLQHFSTPNAELYRGNCVKLIHNIADNSIGFSMFSPPFPKLYVYSNHIEDMGNCKDLMQFKAEFSHMVNPLYAKMQAGRNVVVHCQDIPIQKGKDGFIGLRDFSGLILETFLEAGFIYHSRVTLWKNPVIEMTRTHALGLLMAQIKKDAGMSRVGLPDYLMVFRKPGEHENPVKHQDKDPNGPNFMNVDMWQKIASPVWFDVNFSDTLNLKGTKDEEDEAHICPMSLDTTGRATLLWSNPGDICYTPYHGIGSELCKWVEMGRFGIGNELKESYFNVSIKNVKNYELGKRQLVMAI